MKKRPHSTERKSDFSIETSFKNLSVVLNEGGLRARGRNRGFSYAASNPPQSSGLGKTVDDESMAIVDACFFFVIHEIMIG